LAKLPLSFDELSIKQFYEKYGEPETLPSHDVLENHYPTPTNAPEKPLPREICRNFTFSDTHPLLRGFGEAFFPTLEALLGQDCPTPPAFRAPEAKFESQIPLLYPSNIWSPTTAIWEIIGMKAISSTHFVNEDEIVSQHVDVLRSMPTKWWQRWEGRPLFFDENRYPTKSHSEIKWPPLEEPFEIGVGGEIRGKQKSAFLELMRRMLSFQPKERPTAEYVLI
jgi:hypothetical protein